MLNPEAFKADPVLFVIAWVLMFALIAAPFIYMGIRSKSSSVQTSESENKSNSQNDEVLLIDVEHRGNRQYDRINKRYLPNGELVEEDEKFEVKRPNRKQLPRGKN